MQRGPPWGAGYSAVPSSAGAETETEADSPTCRKISVQRPSPADADGEKQLDHLTGIRCLASLWIVCGHFIPRPEHSTPLSGFRDRANVAVDFFIIMSGFITHWVYRTRPLTTARSIWVFYVRRIGRVALTMWLSMALDIAVEYLRFPDRVPDPGHVVRCLTMVENWLNPVRWCPNGESWTVAAMVPSWLLYPLTAGLLSGVERFTGAVGLVLFALALWLATFGPFLALFVRQHYWLTSDQHNWNYLWPPSQLPDFAIGAATAALALRHQDCGPALVRCRGLAADASVLCALLLCLLVEVKGYREGPEALFNHGLAPLLAVFIYGSAAEGGSGLVARIARHRALLGLGAYSFEVYLFQQPIHSLMIAVGEKTGAYSMVARDRKRNTSTLGFGAFVLVLWTVAGLYVELLQVHIIRFLRSQGGSAKKASLPAAEVDSTLTALQPSSMLVSREGSVG